MIKPGSVIGIIGGGQLAKMIAIEAAYLGYKTHIFSDKQDSPAFEVSSYKTLADYNDMTAIEKFIDNVAVVTLEFENLPHKTLKYIEDRKEIHPNSNALFISQNRLREKSFLNENGIKTAEFSEVKELNDLKKFLKNFNGKAILKTAEFGYDGKGQFMINSDSDLEEIWQQMPNNIPKIAESLVPFSCELSVVMVRNVEGNCEFYDVVENQHINGILYQTTAPADINDELQKKAWEIAKKIADSLNYIGVLAVELFLCDGELLVNEIAPRPHNSGHWTIDACYHSQFEQVVRAVCGLPLGTTKRHSNAKMINLIGDDIREFDKLSGNSNTKLHIYGKNSIVKGRKMGHYTILNLA